jgi:dTDP-glucose 4,6-dehydratase
LVWPCYPDICENNETEPMAQQPLPTSDLDQILNETRPLWEEMRNRHIFITGGTGFFGCWLLESFSHINRQLNLNARATVLTRDPSAFAMKCPHLAADPALAFLAGDVRSFSYPDGEFHYVIHAATESSGRQAASQPLDMLTTIVDGTARVLNFAQTHATRKLLLTSSGAIYGKQPAGLTHVPEEYLGGPDPLDPASVYAEGKRISEQMCALQSAHHPIEIKIARCFAFVGPHLPLDTHFAIGNFIGAVLAGRTIRINGDGTPMRSYLYASDLAIWLWTMLFQSPDLIPVNVGSGHDLSILELARAVVQSLNASVDIHVVKEAIPGADITRYVPSVDRARRLLGLKETVELQEAIRRTAAWYVAEGKGRV